MNSHKSNNCLLTGRLLVLIVLGLATISLKTEDSVGQCQSKEFSATQYALLPESWARKAVSTKVVPTYPEAAIRNNITGLVHVQFEVDDNGNVVRIKSKPRTDPLLARAVARALKQWQFKAWVGQDGLAKSAISHLIFNFRLDADEPKVELYDPGPNAPDVQRLGYHNSAKELRQWREWQEIDPN